MHCICPFFIPFFPFFLYHSLI